MKYWLTFYIITFALSMYDAMFFYKTRDGLLRKGLVVLFLGIALTTASRVICNFAGLDSLLGLDDIITVSPTFLAICIFTIIIIIQSHIKKEK